MLKYMTTSTKQYDFSNLKALFFNCTLKKSPAKSNTEGLINVSAGIMQKHGVQVDIIRPNDHDIATGVNKAGTPTNGPKSLKK
jgi:hypothetical protein